MKKPSGVIGQFAYSIDFGNPSEVGAHGFAVGDKISILSSEEEYYAGFITKDYVTKCRVVCRPYKVLEVSASGKTIKCAPLGYVKSSKPGVYAVKNRKWTDDEVITATLRVDGSFKPSGKSTWGPFNNIHKGARYYFSVGH